MLYDVTSSKTFYILLYIMWLVTMTVITLSDVMDVWPSDVVPNPNPKF